MTELLEKEKEVKELLQTQGAMKLDVLMQRSLEMYNRSHDYTITKANNENLRLNEARGLTFISDDGGKNIYPVSKYALGQLGAKIGVPVNYLDKCVASGRIELAQQNVNSWLEDYNKGLFIRECAGEIRGILSTKYAVCDTHEILEVLEQKLDLSTFNIKGYFLSPERFHLRLVQKERMKVDNEDLFAGVIIDSSDVGRSTLDVRFLVFKQVCTNGLIVSQNSSSLFKQKHIGITAEDFSSGFSKSIEILPEIVAEVTKRIEATRSVKLDKKFSKLSDEEMENLIKQIKEETKLSEANAKKVIEIMQAKRYDISQWGYINALTDVAKGLTLESRLELEKYAGTLLVA